jgi:DNA-binding response OmpR family regulator
MNAPYKVLLVEDDPLLARTLGLSLRYEEFEVTVAASVDAARQSLRQSSYDVVLLDLNLPDGSGLDVCAELRATHPALPILIVTARTDEDSAVESIERGADDYIRKPYGLRELVARIRRLTIKRSTVDDAQAFGNVRLSVSRRSVEVDGSPIHLRKREFDILALLMNANGVVVTRDQVLRAVDRDQAIYDRTIDSHLSHLRKTLSDASASVRIEAVYGVGYRLDTA